MKNEHPITPPPELVQQWVAATESNDCIGAFPTNFEQRICTAAAQWGADQELEACCEYVYERLKLTTVAHIAQDLRTSRRPKPPSFKEQALEMLENTWNAGHMSNNTAQTIRRALEALPDD
jgi:hypothetical protein